MDSRAARWVLGAAVLAIMCQHGCIGKYTAFPEHALQADKLNIRQISISYAIANDSINLPIGFGDYKDTLKRILEDGARVPPAVYSSEDTPGAGYFIRIIHGRGPQTSPLATLMRYVGPFGYIPGVALIVGAILLVVPIPDESGYQLSYVLFSDGERKSVYSYNIKMKTLFWPPLLPFMWVNVFTNNREEAFRATFYQFLIDATQEGYF